MTVAMLMNNTVEAYIKSKSYFMEDEVIEKKVDDPDDMPSHIKMALTRTAEVIPFANGRLCLGTWQGVFLWEHRNHSHERRIILSYQGE